MSSAITGHEVRAVREALGLSVTQFATVLGVHPSSVHRWEGEANRPATIEGVAWPVLSALRQRATASRAARARAAEKGQEISNQLAVGGVLLALAVLLLFAAGRE